MRPAATAVGDWATGVGADTSHRRGCDHSPADNVVPVAIGNNLGGTVLVGAVYRLVYLRRTGERGR